MARAFFLMFIALLFISGCNSEKEPLVVTDASLRSSHLVSKSDTAERLVEHEKIHVIETNMYSFITFYEWLDHETVLYLTDENGVSYLKQFEILSGKEANFFEIADPIIHVEASPDYSAFAIEVASINGMRDIHFVDKNGMTLYTITDLGEEYKIHWNQYNGNELIVVALQKDYSIELFHLDLIKRQLVDFDFEHFFVQWMNENELGYLKWDMFSPSYYAPLYTYNIDNGEEKKLAEKIIAFFSFNNYFLTITVTEEDSNHSTFTFFDTKTKSKLNQLEVPILNTYSEQWWIPNHVFHQLKKTFYYVQPTKSGDLFQYSDGFSLVSFQVETGKRQEVASFAENFPIKISPDGRWLLFGYQLEQIIDIKKGEISSLVYW